MTHQAALTRYIHFCEHMTRENTGLFAELYTENAYFKDPFNEVRGHAAIIAIFEHMYTQVERPKFVVIHRVLQDDDAFLTWEFLFRFKSDKNKEQCIRGSTHLQFYADGRVAFHRDYWDAAEELYEKIPLLGGLMRLIKRMARR